MADVWGACGAQRVCVDTGSRCGQLELRIRGYSLEFGLVASLGGRHHWETLSSRLFSHLFFIPPIQTVPLFTVQYYYLNTRYYNPGNRQFFQGLLEGLSVGSSCSHVALSCLYSYRCAASSPVASTDTCTACTGIRSDLDPAKQIM